MLCNVLFKTYLNYSALCFFKARRPEEGIMMTGMLLLLQVLMQMKWWMWTCCHLVSMSHLRVSPVILMLLSVVFTVFTVFELRYGIWPTAA